MIQNLWQHDETGHRPEGIDLLVYRSNLLGADRRVCNWGGGNTSWKTQQEDQQGRCRPVLWVKGSGSDLATITAPGFTGLWLDDVEPLSDRESMADAEMVDYLSRCYVQPVQPRPSIETLMHAFLPFRHIDHTHADAAVIFACSRDGEKMARDCWGERVVWVPYIRPGFALARQVALALKANPSADVVLLGKHGLITWGDTAQESYANTIRVINEAYAFINAHMTDAQALGRVVAPSHSAEQRKVLAEVVLAVLLDALGGSRSPAVVWDDSVEVLDFLSFEKSREVSQRGAACPDHIIRTKFVPLWVDFDRAAGPEGLRSQVLQGLESYSEAYRQYWSSAREQVGEDTRAASEVMDDPLPRIILVPGVGMFSAGRDEAMARVAGSLYHRAISVMQGAEALGGFVSLTPAQGFDIEYWPLERYKLALSQAG